MKYCILTEDETGLTGRICEHFGSAPTFTLYDSDSGEVEVVKNRQAQHRPGACRPLAQLKRLNIEAVVCRGMGHRAVETMGRAGITIYCADADRVEGVVESIKADELAPAAQDAVLCRHGHGGGHGHACSAGQQDRSGRGGRGARGEGRGGGGPQSMS